MAPGGYAATDDYTRSYKAVQSADFFCGIVPGSVLSQLGKAMNLEGAAGLAMKRLSREGLSWVPTAGNLCTLMAFGVALYINSYLTSESHTAGQWERWSRQRRHACSLSSSWGGASAARCMQLHTWHSCCGRCMHVCATL